MTTPEGRTSMAFWFPKVWAAGLPVPRTITVGAEDDLLGLLDGDLPPGWSEFSVRMENAIKEIGSPCFLRSAYGSGKHEWSQTCFLERLDDWPKHVVAIVEWSHMVDMFGLPTDCWFVRELIPTEPLFVCEGWYGFPVVREFRVFVRSAWEIADPERPVAERKAAPEVEGIYPYWPEAAVAAGDPDRPDWRERLAEAARLAPGEAEELSTRAREAACAVGGEDWSVDFLQGADGRWWLTDMAAAEISWRPDTGGKE